MLSTPQGCWDPSSGDCCRALGWDGSSQSSLHLPTLLKEAFPPVLLPWGSTASVKSDFLQWESVSGSPLPILVQGLLAGILSLDLPSPLERRLGQSSLWDRAEVRTLWRDLLKFTDIAVDCASADWMKVYWEVQRLNLVLPRFNFPK